MLLGLLLSTWRILRGALRSFQRHGCGSLAASLAYFALLSFFPMVFLIVYVVSFFLTRDQIRFEFLLSFLHAFLPSLGTDLALEIKRVVNEHVVRWVVFGTFCWFGILVFYEVDYTINVVFETGRRRHALISTALSGALLGLVGLLFTASYLVTEVTSALLRYAPQIAGIDLFLAAAHRYLLEYALPFIGVLVAVTSVYRLLPQSRPAWSDAVVGGIIFTLLWELAKHVFGRYIQGLAIYGRMYGSFLASILFLVWVYYSAALLLFGAEIVHRRQADRLTASP